METKNQVEIILFVDEYRVGGGSPVWDDFFERFSHLIDKDNDLPVERFDSNVLSLFKLFIEEGEKWISQQEGPIRGGGVYTPFRIARVDINRPFWLSSSNEFGTESIIYKDTIPWMVVNEIQLEGVTEKSKQS
jgi:hypothetical protein